MASMPMLLVAATHPIIKGKAPGIAPIKTENGLTNFIGVYNATYRNKEMDASIATFILIKYIKKIPNSEHIIAINNAKICEISFFGSGRFLVLAINLSKSFSII